ncbi:MAG: cytochrome c biogenesis protein CcdA [Bacilli bacterium]|nr:cytochrome c biogenesis protein CcdA [Bacilli bacterium]
MIYILTFLEGLLSFISPCILPMLPLYFSYIIGSDKDNKYICFLKTVCFTLGLSACFIILGTISGMLGEYIQKIILGNTFNTICGIIIIIFGLIYIISIYEKFRFLNIKTHFNISTAFGSFLFGLIFVIYLVPCAGPLLGSALTLAASLSGKMQGAILLLLYSLGISIPFLICSLILDNLKAHLAFLRKNSEIIKKICGVILIILGILITFNIINPSVINSFFSLS